MINFPAPVRDAALLLLRVAVGAIFLAHGLQKLLTNTIDGTAAFFTQAGVPLPTVSAWAATILEIVGGAALIVGIAVPLAGVLLALDMLGAFVFVHAGNGLFVTKNGYELVLALGAASLALAAVGAGRFSLDHALFGRRAGSSAQPSRV